MAPPPLITKLANMSISAGVFPSSVKQGRVTPLLKKPGLYQTEMANYRPIIVNLIMVSKMLEKLALRHLQPHVTSAGNFGQFQSIYQAEYSTETAMLDITYEFTILLKYSNVKSIGVQYTLGKIVSPSKYFRNYVKMKLKQFFPICMCIYYMQVGLVESWAWDGEVTKTMHGVYIYFTKNNGFQSLSQRPFERFYRLTLCWHNPFAKLRPSRSSFRGDICENVFHYCYNIGVKPTAGNNVCYSYWYWYCYCICIPSMPAAKAELISSRLNQTMQLLPMSTCGFSVITA